jgi:hypothetical protein
MNITLDTNTKLSIFEIKDFEEDINTDILSKLINSDLLQTVSWTVGNQVFENEKQQLLLLKKLIKNNKLKVSYKRPKYNLGRVYPNKSLSLCSIRRELRHTLAYGNYIDIDIANCHPELLNQLCIHHDIKTKYLNEYVKNRDAILSETMIFYDCNRDEAKTLFISLMYYGAFNSWNKGANKEPTEFIYNFINELKIISENFINVNPAIVKIVKALHKKNEKGSVMSIILQEKERIVLECVYNALIKKNIVVNNDCVLCFDGIMIKQNKYSNNLLEELSNIVYEELKFKLTFTQKEFNEHYLEELKNITYEKQTIYNIPHYLELKAKFELTCFRLENPYNYVYLDGDNNIQLFNNEKLKNWTMKDYAVSFQDPENEKIKKYFIDVWITDPNQKSYNKIVFDPSLKSINNYNFFSGFKYTDGEQAVLENPFLSLLKRVCNDKKTYDYFVDWIAHIIQKPYKKTNIAIILYSNIKGVGKNCIVDGICKLLKGYSAHVETIDDITKNFNSHLVNKLFIYGDEIKASSKCVSDKLKQVITRPTQNMEKKGKDAFEIDDFTNWLFTTNNRDAFKVEQGDRRLFFVECINEKLNKDLSTEYYKYIENDDEINKLFNFFKNHTIINNIGVEAPPTSRMKNELEYETKPAYIQMLYKQPREIIDNRFTSQRLYEKSKTFATTNYLNHSYSITEFGTEMSKVLSKFKKRTGSGYVYDVNVNFNELNKILFEYDNAYYRYINNIEENEIPTFTGNDDPISSLDNFNN